MMWLLPGPIITQECLIKTKIVLTFLAKRVGTKEGKTETRVYLNRKSINSSLFDYFFSCKVMNMTYVVQKVTHSYRTIKSLYEFQLVKSF